MQQEKLNIAVFVDYDNIEIGVKSTLRREFDVGLPLEALKERGDIVAKFAYANWGRQEGAARQMAENAVQMVQRLPSPRGDKNGGDINLALDSLEMAFTHRHVNAFAIISGDSDFIPLVNKLKEYGKTVFVVGGKAFTSTILQQNCHEFISYESLLPDKPEPVPMPDTRPEDRGRRGRGERGERTERGGERGERSGDRGERSGGDRNGGQRNRPPALELNLVMPLVERALQVLERRGVQPQLGLLKSTMLQLDSTFNERAYGSGSFSDFVDKLRKAELIGVSGTGGRFIIERRGGSGAHPMPQPEEALPMLRDTLENHRLEIEDGVLADDLATWMTEDHPNYHHQSYGYQGFSEFLNFAQDKQVVRVEQDEDRGQIVYLGAEFYPPAPPPQPELPPIEEEDDGPQPYVEGQPTILDPNPPPAKPKKVASRPRKSSGPPRKRPPGGAGSAPRRPPRKRT